MREALITSGLLNTVHGLHGLTRIFGTKTLLIRENPWIFPLSMFISPFNQSFPAYAWPGSRFSLTKRLNNEAQKMKLCIQLYFPYNNGNKPHFFDYQALFSKNSTFFLEKIFSVL
jgi:hypothetical protein